MVKKHFNRLKDLKQKEMYDVFKDVKIETVLRVQQDTKYFLYLQELYNEFYIPNKELIDLVNTNQYDFKENKEILQKLTKKKGICINDEVIKEIEMLKKYDKNRKEMIDVLKSLGFNIHIVKTFLDLKCTNGNDIYISFIFDMTAKQISTFLLMYDMGNIEYMNIPILINSYTYFDNNKNGSICRINDNKAKLYKEFRNDEDLLKCSVCFTEKSEIDLIKTNVVCCCSASYCVECYNKLSCCCICKNPF